MANLIWKIIRHWLKGQPHLKINCSLGDNPKSDDLESDNKEETTFTRLEGQPPSITTRSLEDDPEAKKEADAKKKDIFLGESSNDYTLYYLGACNVSMHNAGKMPITIEQVCASFEKIFFKSVCDLKPEIEFMKQGKPITLKPGKGDFVRCPSTKLLFQEDNSSPEPKVKAIYAIDSYNKKWSVPSKRIRSLNKKLRGNPLLNSKPFKIKIT